MDLYKVSSFHAPGAIFGQPGTNILYRPKFVIVVIIVNSEVAVRIIWRNGWRKMHKNAQIFVLQFKIFPEGMLLTPMLGGAMAPFPKPHPLGTPALRVSLGGSIVPPSMFVRRWRHCYALYQCNCRWTSMTSSVFSASSTKQDVDPQRATIRRRRRRRIVENWGHPLPQPTVN